MRNRAGDAPPSAAKPMPCCSATRTLRGVRSKTSCCGAHRPVGQHVRPAQAVPGAVRSTPSPPDLADPILQIVVVRDPADAAFRDLEEGPDAEPVGLPLRRRQPLVAGEVAPPDEKLGG